MGPRRVWGDSLSSHGTFAAWAVAHDTTRWSSRGYHRARRARRVLRVPDDRWGGYEASPSRHRPAEPVTATAQGLGPASGGASVRCCRTAARRPVAPPGPGLDVRRRTPCPNGVVPSGRSGRVGRRYQTGPPHSLGSRTPERRRGVRRRFAETLVVSPRTVTRARGSLPRPLCTSWLRPGRRRANRARMAARRLVRYAPSAPNRRRHSPRRPALRRWSPIRRRGEGGGAVSCRAAREHQHQAADVLARRHPAAAVR